MSADTLERVNNASRFAHRYLGQVRLRGRQKALDVCEVFESDDDAQRARKQATRERFEAGVRHHLADDLPAAIAAFDAVLAQNPDDEAARRYRGRSLDPGHPEHAAPSGPATLNPVGSQ